MLCKYFVIERHSPSENGSEPKFPGFLYSYGVIQISSSAVWTRWQFISLHIRSMWETTVMHKQVSGRTVNFGPNFPDQSLLRNTPPPQKLKADLGTLLLFSFRIPPRKLKFRQILALCYFSVSEYPPPRKLKFRQILALCYFSVSEYPPPRKLKFRQILALCYFSVSEYPPPQKKIEI